MKLYLIITKTPSKKYPACKFYRFELAQTPEYGRVNLNLKPSEAYANLGLKYGYLHSLPDGETVIEYVRKEQPENE